MVGNAHGILRDAMAVEWRLDCEAQLAKVFMSAQELYRLLTAQRALYWMEMSPVDGMSGVRTFQPDSMADVDGSGDDIELSGQQLVLSIFPAIFKVDESDGNVVSSSQG